MSAKVRCCIVVLLLLAANLGTLQFANSAIAAADVKPQEGVALQATTCTGTDAAPATVEALADSKDVIAGVPNQPIYAPPVGCYRVNNCGGLGANNGAKHTTWTPSWSSKLAETFYNLQDWCWAGGGLIVNHRDLGWPYYQRIGPAAAWNGWADWNDSAGYSFGAPWGTQIVGMDMVGHVESHDGTANAVGVLASGFQSAMFWYHVCGGIGYYNEQTYDFQNTNPGLIAPSITNWPAYGMYGFAWGNYKSYARPENNRPYPWGTSTYNLCALDNSTGPWYTYRWKQTDSIWLKIMAACGSGESAAKKAPWPEWTCPSSTLGTPYFSFWGGASGWDQKDPLAAYTGTQAKMIGTWVNDSVTPGIAFLDESDPLFDPLCIRKKWEKVQGQFRICGRPWDNSGISRITVSIDGDKVRDTFKSCDYTYKSPCPNSTAPVGESKSGTSSSANFNYLISAVPYALGNHTCSIAVADAAGDLSSLDCNFQKVSDPCVPGGAGCPNPPEPGSKDPTPVPPEAIPGTTANPVTKPSATSPPNIFSYTLMGAQDSSQNPGLGAGCQSLGPFTTGLTTPSELNQIVSVNINLLALTGSLEGNPGEHHIRTTLMLPARQTDDYLYALGCQ